MKFEIEQSPAYSDIYRVYIDHMVLRFNEKEIAYSFDRFCYIVFLELKSYKDNSRSYIDVHTKEIERLQKELRKWVKLKAFK